MVEALVLIAAVQACALGIGAAGVLFWIRRRLDAQDVRLARLAPSPPPTDPDAPPPPVKLHGLRSEIPEHFKATMAGVPEDYADLARRSAPTPPGPLTPVPPTPKKQP